MEIDIKYFLLPIAFILLFAIGLFAQQPLISSVSHNQGFNGQLIEISGSGFSTNPTELIVRFGAMKGTVLSSTNNFIEVQVPIGATFSSIAVTHTTSNLTGFSGSEFYPIFSGETTDAISISTRFNFPSVDNKEFFDLVIVDLDEDGKNDVVTTKIDPTASDIIIYKNTSVSTSITFVEQSQFIGNPTVNIAHGDIDGDGKVDLVLSRGGNLNRNQIYVLRNTSSPGTISFAAAKSYFLTAAHFAKKVVIRDLDLDGKSEVVVSNTFNNEISIFKNNSTPGIINLSFTPTLLTITGAITTNGLAIGDINTDGKPDLVISQFLDEDIFIVPNESVDGNLIFGTQQVLSLVGNLNNVAVADLNLDGQLDILVTMPLQTRLAVFKNEGTGFTFSPAETLDTGLNCWGIGLGDYTGNGKADVVITASSGNTFAFFKNVSESGNIELTKTDIGQTLKTRNAAIGDLSGDAKPDLALTAYSNSTSELLVIRNTTCIEPKILNNDLSSQICNATLPFVFKVMPAEGATFIWKNGEVEVQNSTDSNFEAGHLGVYTVTSVSEDGSCIMESQKMVLDTVPKPSFDTGDSLFIDHEVQFFNITDSILGQFPIYNWDFGDGTTSTDKHPRHTFTEAKDYLVTLGVIYGDISCSSSVSQILSIKKLNSETEILSFTMPQQIAPATIDVMTHSINIDVKYDTDVFFVVPTFTLSSGANSTVALIDQISGVTVNNFATPLIYTITAEDRLAIQEWTVSVTIAPNLKTNILSFSIPEQIKETVLDSINHTVKIEVEYETNVSKLIPTYILSTGASATIDGVGQVSSVTENDFTDPITYTIHAYSEGAEEWVVSVKALNIETEVKSFSISEQTSEAWIDLAAHTIGIEADYETDLTSVVPSFSLSHGATAEVEKIVQVSGVTTNNFTSPVIYKITAENGIYIQDWTIAISIITGIHNTLIPTYVGNPYPNPFSNRINIPFITNSNQTKIHVTMYDIFGKSLFIDGIRKPSSSNFNYAIDMNSLGTKLQSGIYILEIEIWTNSQIEKFTRKVFFKGY